MIDSIFLLFITGFILGIQHAFEPDHLVAVSVFATENKNIRASAWLGFSWGLGHTTTLFLLGGGVLLLNIVIPPSLESFLEFMVGLLLIFIGVYILYRIWTTRIHLHPHDHPNRNEHTHFHLHQHSTEHTHNHQSSWRGFLFGLVHGIAGSSAAVLLVVSIVDKVWQGLILILLFGIGSIGGMLLVTLLIGTFMTRLSHHQRWMEYLKIGTALISIVMGSIISLQILIA